MSIRTTSNRGLGRVLSLLVAGMLLGGCTSMMLSGGGVTRSTGSEQGASQDTSDKAISAEIKNRYRRAPEVDVFNVSVRTVDGKVTLTGMVESYEARNEAYRLARQVEGVHTVVNQIRVVNRSQ